jgi:hypothetical protein
VGKNKVLEILIFGIWLLVVAMLLVRYAASKRESAVPDFVVPRDVPESISGKRLAVKRIVVVDGDTYDLVLRDGERRVLVDLDVAAASEIKQKVISMLNKSMSPEVLLEKKGADGRWIGKIFVKLDGRDTDLSSWLRENKLTYE